MSILSKTSTRAEQIASDYVGRLDVEGGEDLTERRAQLAPCS